MSDLTVPPKDVVIARRIMFSTAHFYEQKKWSPTKNREVFGACYTPHGHGHNYILEVFVRGKVDSRTKMVMNVTDLDKIMKEASADFDHHHINFDIPEFATPEDGSPNLVPTTEVIALYLRKRIKAALPKHLKLERIKLFETADIFVELHERSQRSKKFILTQEVEIRAMHSLINRKFTQKQNEKMLGMCARPHGHNYKIQVSLSGQKLDTKSAMLLNRGRLNEVLQQKLVCLFDGRDLNQIFPNTACEALAYEIYQYLQPILRKEFPKLTLHKIGIQETAKNYFEF